MADPHGSMAPDAVKDEAALWVARLRGGACTLDDERAFRAWLTADPSHSAAFEAMQAMWELSAALPSVPSYERYRRSRPLLRREVMWSLGATAAAAGAFATWQSAAAKTYETKIGEQKHITLPDNSLMFLDTATRVSFRTSGGKRLARLEIGRANFRVTADGGRPFLVEARGQTVITDRSRLDISDDGRMTSIILIDGRARVEIGGEGQARALLGGERLRVSGKTITSDKPNLTPLLAWQRGQVVFENQTLKQAAAELNRYSDTKIFVEDPVVASWRVSGVFAVGDNYAFVKAASKFLPLSMEQVSGGILMMQNKDTGKLG